MRQTVDNQSGFTLVELLIGVGLMAILAMIAMPQYEKYLKKAKAVEAEEILQDIERLQLGYYLDTGMYATDLSTLGYTLPAGLTYQITINLNPETTGNSGSSGNKGKGKGTGGGKKDDKGASLAVYEVLATANLDNDADLDALRLTKNHDDGTIFEHGCIVGGSGSFTTGCAD